MSETCREFVERIWAKSVTDDQLEGLLWHCTAFPFVCFATLKKQLTKVRDESGGDYDKAMAQAEEQITQAMKETK